MTECHSSYSPIVLNCLRRLVSALHVASRQTEKQLGMSTAQLFALQKLEDGQKRSLNDLASLTYTHQSSLSVVVRKLVAKGLIESSAAPEDSRRLMLGLTDQGRNVLSKASASVPDRLLTALAGMEPQDQRQLGDLLTRLLDRAAMSETRAELFFEYDELKTQEESHDNPG
ncbi:MAG TPA: MarR family winged helix-turn-helix transcriptional regulator [Oligoflexus sp.]|uniref:MarR family winged helix-turn-helix transcriptional regulator n=1 Tax=Oligoflexus sp. TaxID=1971216 RepID=UPI002D6889DD|nr:MarR family winged helix-turn-helix transcriptional regulator [Oligoflexus sp.]HYX33552.1 MarR family winged helix-turn-helix transcriptional regulator [Oligoflexus sp.]